MCQLGVLVIVEKLNSFAGRYSVITVWTKRYHHAGTRGQTNPLVLGKKL